MNNNNNNINNNNNNIFLELIPHKIFSFCEIIEYFILLKHQKMKNIFLLVAKEKIFICDENLKILFKKEFLFNIDYLIELSNSLILFSEKTFFYLTKIKYKKKNIRNQKNFLFLSQRNNNENNRITKQKNNFLLERSFNKNL